MTTDIMLASWTDQGIRGVKDRSPLRRGEEGAHRDGGSLQSFYLTMGDYDSVAVYDAPDDAVAARFNLQLGMPATCAPAR